MYYNQYSRSGADTNIEMYSGQDTGLRNPWSTGLEADTIIELSF